MVLDIKKMIDAILRQKLNLTKDELLQMIEEKKQRVGAGYLTDQGALFLVAADLGITIEEPPKLEMSLKDVYVGAKEVSIIARVMSVYPLRRYRRKDGSEVLLRTLTVYDNDARVKVKLWEDKANLPDSLGIKPGDAIKISKAYVRAGMDGKVTINVGARSSIELVSDNVPHIRELENIAIDVGEITGSEENAVVTGIVKGSPRVSSFVNFRGEQSKVMHMQISGTDGKTLRVVLWNVDEQRIPKVMNLGSTVKLIGVRTKRNQNGDIELHGDEGTLLVVDEQEEIEVMPLRIIAVSKNTGKKQDSFALAVDRAKRIFTMVINDQFVDQLKINQMIECVPSRVYGSTLLLQDDAYVRTMEDDSSFPTSDSLECKVKDIKTSQDLYFLETITLTESKVQDFQMKDGSTVRYAEIMLGDDTGEIRLVGWREMAGVVENLKIGQRVKVYGVMAYAGRDGNTELRLKPFSNIIKL